MHMGKNYTKCYKWILLALVSSTYFLAQGTRQIYNTVLPQIKADFAAAGACLTDTDFGLVSSAFTLVFGIVMPLGGFFADFFSRKWMIVIGTVLFSIGIFMSGFAAGLGLLLVAYGTVNATGQALMPPSNSSLIGQFHVKTRATAFSIYQIVFYVGIVVCSCVSGWLSGLGEGGWRKAFLLFGAIGVAWSFLLAFVMRDTPQPKAADGAEEKASLKEALVAFVGKPSALLLMLGVGTYLYAKYAYNTWIIDYLQRDPLLMSKEAAAFHGVFWFYLCATIGVFAAGRFSDRFAAKNGKVRFDVNIAGLLLFIPGLLLTAYAPNAALCVAGTGVLGFASGVYDSNFYASLFEVVKPRYRAAAVGVFGFGGAVIGAIGPVMLGWMSAHFSMSAGIASLSYIALFGAAAIFVARTFFFARDKVSS